MFINNSGYKFELSRTTPAHRTIFILLGLSDNNKIPKALGKQKVFSLKNSFYDKSHQELNDNFLFLIISTSKYNIIPKRKAATWAIVLIKGKINPK